MGKYMSLWLEGPLQSWGTDSRFYRRSTENFPSRSALLGMILAAMGAPGEQRELLSLFDGLAQTVISFKRKDSDKPLQLKDFHMVGSGYDGKDPWQNMMIPKTTEGKAATGGGTKLTYRHYLQDAAFGAILELPEGEAGEKAASAMQRPVWDTSLGRKSCPPSDFVYRGVYHSEEEALKALLEIAETKDYAKEFTVTGSDGFGGEKIILNDTPVCFGTNKKYKERTVYIIREENG